MGYTYDPKGLNDGSKQRNILLGIYIIAVVVTQYMFNMRLTQSICGQVQSGSAFMMTLIPNVLMSKCPTPVNVFSARIKTAQILQLFCLFLFLFRFLRLFCSREDVRRCWWHPFL